MAVCLTAYPCIMMTIKKLGIDFKEYLATANKDFVFVDPPWFYNNKETRLTMKTQFSMVENNLDFLNYLFKIANTKILFLWITSPMLGYFVDHKNKIDLSRFEYRQILTWAKTTNTSKLLEGSGYWFKNTCEYLLVFVRKDAKPLRSRALSYCQESATKNAQTRKPKLFESLIMRELYNAEYLEGAYIFSGNYEDYDISSKQNFDLVDICFKEMK